jgi:hypothetical protein
MHLWKECLANRDSGGLLIYHQQLPIGVLLSEQCDQVQAHQTSSAWKKDLHHQDLMQAMFVM